MSRNLPKRLYFVGIAGTGMASAAGLCKEAGFEIIGSDDHIYPPMSLMLADLKIPVLSPYTPENIENVPCDLYIIGNSLSKNHPEVAKIIEKGHQFTSFPNFLGENILKHRFSVVVAGTHGKTTTTSLLTHLLTELGEQPGYLIGGVPKNLETSFSLGRGLPFIIEGDEYDTAFFDKESKFLHYHPKICILNNIEFDHADIFKDINAVERMFEKLLTLVSPPSHIIANTDDTRVKGLLEKIGILNQITKTSADINRASDIATRVKIKSLTPSIDNYWQGIIATDFFGDLHIRCILAGQHNWSNIVQTIAALIVLTETGQISPPNPQTIEAAFVNFKGVKRRLDLLANCNNINIFEDFAHHPTAVREVIKGFRQSYPNRRLIIAFEPKNATSRRNVFTEKYATEFKAADLVLIGACPVDSRIAPNEQMNIFKLAERVGDNALAFKENNDLYAWLLSHIQPGDSIIFMSSGSFSGIHHSLAQDLQNGILSKSHSTT